MSQGGVTVTGFAEARAAVDALPETVTSVSKGIAKRTADRIAVNAATILRSKTHGSGRTGASIRVLDESADQQYTVNVPGDPDDPANLPWWIEKGTRFQVARPFLRPAGDAENDRYKQEMAAVLERTVSEALK